MVQDGSGTISADEIKKVLGADGQLSEKQIEKMINEVDDDKNGEISEQEFFDMMTKLTEGMK